MEMLKKKIRVNRIGKMITDQFAIEDDYNVPDNKADVGRVVTGEGHLRIDEVKEVESYLKVCGNLHFKILYVTDSAIPTLASMEGKMPFEEMVYVDDNAEGEMQVQVARVDFHASMIHSRKLEIKTIAELSLHREQIENDEAPTMIETEKRIFQKKCPVEVLQLYENKRDIYRIKEEITLPGTKENIENVIWEEVALRKLDTKLSQGALILNGELQIFCIYQSQEEKIDWVEQIVPFEGQVLCQGADESFFHHVYRKLSDANVEVRMDEDGEMRALGIEAALEMRILIYEEEKMELLEDAYSLDEVCHLGTKRVFLEELVMQNHSRYKIAERLNLPEVRDEMLQVCHGSGEVQIEKMETVDEGIQIEGILHVSFLYVKANDRIPFDGWSGMIPFSYLMECENCGIDLRYDITYGLEQMAIELIGNGEIEVKAVLAFQSFLRRPVNLEIISDISFEPFDEKEQEKRPGIVGYIAKKGDDLWSLAKKYSTTEESIMNVNGLMSKELKEGDKILIFKENMSIL